MRYLFRLTKLFIVVVVIFLLTELLFLAVWAQGPTVVTVDTTSVKVDGITSTVSALLDIDNGGPGPDGKISFTEALAAVNNTGPGHTINFNLPHGSTISFNSSLDLFVANTTIEGDVDGNGTPDVMLLYPADGFITLRIWSDNNIIRNLVIKGLDLFGSAAHNNLITKSYIGTGVEGKVAIPRLGSGIIIRNGAHHNLIENNIIAGNKSVTFDPLLGWSGVSIDDAHDNQLRGNRIGLNVDGDPLPNDFGVHVDNGATRNVIGGKRTSTACDGPCNIMSGNQGSGVILRDTGTISNVVEGNYIGLDPTGVTAMPNGVRGVLIFSGATQNVIGGERSGTACDGPCNVICGNQGPGVELDGDGTDKNVVQGNYIGLNPLGTVRIPNALLGVFIENGAADNLIGGERSGSDCDGPCNIISGNNGPGVVLEDTGTISNVVQGNYIGVNHVGTAPIPNEFPGVWVGSGASQNLIGGERSGTACDGPCNVISGNNANGVVLRFAGTISNVVQGNYIGVNPGGTAAMPNTPNGIEISNGASQNTIGGERSGTDCDDLCNFISGNSESGVVLTGNGTSNNVVLGNYIGLSSIGNFVVPNGQFGVKVVDGASQNTIGGKRASVDCTGPCNFISGNGKHGLVMTGTDTILNVVEGNYIGLDILGGYKPNESFGLEIAGGARQNVIGGVRSNTACSGPCNVIGSKVHGIYIHDNGTDFNRIKGNYIGVTPDGSRRLAFSGLSAAGVVVDNGAAQNTIGGWRASATCDGPCNVISGNDQGVNLVGGSTNNSVQGNFIGVDATGTSRLPNASIGVVVAEEATQFNTIGGDRVGTVCNGPCNVISGNDSSGVGLFSTNNNMVKGNFIGVNPLGDNAIPNQSGGVWLEESIQNTIGGKRSGTACNGPCNVISGNSRDGIFLFNTDSNEINGNYIGLEPAGARAIPNQLSGVRIEEATQNNIGGERAGTVCDGPCNVISGNIGAGVILEPNALSNVIQGNYIGVNPLGATAMPNNLSGVEISRGASQNMIGGNRVETACDGPCNVISGNSQAGIAVGGGDLSGDASSNSIQGNYIGLNSSGTGAIPNTFSGVEVGNGAKQNIIGGERSGASCDGPCNVIGGNGQAGISLLDSGTTGNLVQGNYIGLNPTGTSNFPNNLMGILIQDGASQNTIGGERTSATCDGTCNVVSGNASAGVAVAGVATINNAVLGNIIFDNDGLGIDLGADGVTPNDPGDSDAGANNLQNFPTLISAVYAGSVTIQGTLNSIPDTVFRLEFFANDNPDPSGFGEGANFLGAAVVTTDANGETSFDITLSSGNLINKFITATATDPDNNTSEFSQPVQVTNPGMSFVVNSTDDIDDSVCNTAHCSLREAINAANALDGADTIVFNIPGAGPHTIQPFSALPTLSSPVVIDGTTEPDFAGIPIIELDGSQAGPSGDGLRIIAGSSRIQGLLINRFGGAGIAINGASNNTIGGTTPGLGNIIAYNGGQGIVIVDSTGNSIQSNSIVSNGSLGIDLGADGVTPNDPEDVDMGANNTQNFPLLNSAISDINNTTIAGTLNSVPNTLFRLDIYANATCDPSGYGEGETYLGSKTATTDARGDVAFTAHFSTTVPAGQFISATATDPDNNTSEFAACVTVQTAGFSVNSTNDANGVCDVSHCSLREAINTANARPGTDIIAFNIPGDGPYIIAPTIPLPTISDPVIIDGRTQPGFTSTPIIELAGTQAGEGDDGLGITAGNSIIRGLMIRDFYGDGIKISENGGNIIQGNYIRVNLGNGIRITGSSNNTVGGPTIRAGNTIPAAGDAGIAVLVNSTGNLIQGNSMFNLGIDLSGKGYTDGVTPNDAGDQDTGGNNLQNFPVLTSFTSDSISTTIKGSLNSSPNTLFRLDFYANTDCGNPYHAGGETFLGSETVTTNGSGDTTFTVTILASVPDGQFVTATATDPDNNTSEFSLCEPDPTPDTTPPVFPDSPLVKPKNGETLHTSRPEFDWLDAIEKNLELYLLYLELTGQLPSTAEVTVETQTTFTFTTTESIFTPTIDLPNGVYTWTVVARDEAGNVSQPVPSQSFTIQVPSNSYYFPLIMKN
jgi:CSLREA domain-containing protein